MVSRSTRWWRRPKPPASSPGSMPSCSGGCRSCRTCSSPWRCARLTWCWPSSSAPPSWTATRSQQRSDHLSASVRDIATPPEQPEVRAALARFVGPLSRMLLLSGGLLLALRGELDTPAAPVNTPPAQTPRPDNPAPSQWDAAAPSSTDRSVRPWKHPWSTRSGASWLRTASWGLPGRRSQRRSSEQAGRRHTPAGRTRGGPRAALVGGCKSCGVARRRHPGRSSRPRDDPRRLRQNPATGSRAHLLLGAVSPTRAASKAWLARRIIEVGDTPGSPIAAEGGRGQPSSTVSPSTESSKHRCACARSASGSGVS